MLGSKNAVYMEVFGDTMGQRLMRLNNVEWRRGEQLRMQVIFARVSLEEIVKYITVELKLNAKNEAHVQDRQGQGHRGNPEDRQHREVQGDTRGSGRSPLLRVRSAQHEGEWAGQVQVEPPGPQDQEPQRTAEDREPAAFIPRVQIAAHRLLGLLRQGEQPCT